MIDTKEKELLRKQMELLEKQSKSAEERDLVHLSTAMCEIYRELQAESRRGRVPLCVTLFSVVGLDLLVSIVILVEKLFGR